MQAVVLQQYRRWRGCVTLVAHELVGIFQASGGAVLQADAQLAAFDLVSRCVLVRASGQWHGLVEEVAGKFNDFGTAHGVVALAFFCAAFFADGVCAVQRVIQRAPAGVGSVQGVAGVQNGHDQLGASDLGQFGVHVFGGGLGVLGLLDQVADLLQKLLVTRHIGDGAGVGLVPGVQLLLQAVTLGQQGGVLGGQVVDQGIKALPEGGGIDPGAGQHLFVDEVVQFGGHLQAVDGGTCCHGATSLNDGNAGKPGPQGGSALPFAGIAYHCIANECVNKLDKTRRTNDFYAKVNDTSS